VINGLPLKTLSVDFFLVENIISLKGGKGNQEDQDTKSDDLNVFYTIIILTR